MLQRLKGSHTGSQTWRETEQTPRRQALNKATWRPRHRQRQPLTAGDNRKNTEHHRHTAEEERTADLEAPEPETRPQGLQDTRRLDLTGPTPTEDHRPSPSIASENWKARVGGSTGDLTGGERRDATRLPESSLRAGTPENGTTVTDSDSKPKKSKRRRRSLPRR
ncbi:unnamed protein product [Microthlaspi erraticum]|uniref:Uncharacterized protein n=1 Tax=Microthlaspi erraticum TaxID=1685480 RepID=A0A6D2JZA6_9BRAS|nr:unnamed protein product [Microthlaspi erraticum]